MATTLARLVDTANRKGRASASDGRWTARREGSAVIVRHFTTDMIAVDTITRDVTPISRGWGSMTDKIGVGRVLRGFGIVGSYASVFGGQS